MQENNSKSNQDRTEKTRSALKQAMRKLVLNEGYAGAATPTIVKEAGVTRGALYHHFSDKKELFRAIVEEDCQAVAQAIDNQRPQEKGSLAALKSGADAFITAMAGKGRTQIILIEAPSVLGRKELAAIENKYARGQLRNALKAAMEKGILEKLPLSPLTEQLSAMFDAASLGIENGRVAKNQALLVVHRIIDGLCI